MKNSSIKPPPPDNFDLPLVHKVREFYQRCYRLGNKIPKRDKFGLWAKIEILIIEILSLTIETTWQSRLQKSLSLEKAKLKIELLKQLVRLAEEIKIIEREIYLNLQTQLQEISKMTSGWLKFSQTQKEP